MFWQRLFCLIFVAIAVLPAKATTVAPRVRHCPVCQNEFVTQEIGSWFQFAEPERDLEGSLFTAVSTVKSCPYCLFTALPEGFEKLETNDVATVRHALKDLPRKVRLLPKNDPSEPIDSTDRRMVHIMEYRVAEVCNSARKKDWGRSAELAFAEYTASKHYPLNDSVLVTEARLRAITNIEAALTANVWTNEDKALWDYLAGELHRRNGDFKKAIQRLEEAAQSSSCPPPIAGWAKEQSNKAHAGDTNVPPSNVKLHSDAAELLLAELPTKLPRMLSAISAGKPASEWLLSGEAKTSTVWRIKEMASKGNKNAINYLVAWLSRLSVKELKDRTGSIGNIVSVIAEHPAAVDDVLLQKLKFQVPAMRDVIVYAIQKQKFPQQAEKSLTRGGNLDAITEGAIAVAIVYRDITVKPLLLAQIKKSSRYSLVDAVEKYFGNVGTADDIPALEVFAKKFGYNRKHQIDETASMRANVESAIRNIQLRRVFGFE